MSPSTETSAMSLDQALAALAHQRGDAIVIATMSAGFMWPAHSNSARDFCYIAPMGSAAAIGLGLALARPDLRVCVLDGEGSLLMNLGVLVTIAEQRPANLIHIVLNNHCYAITGGQPVPGVGGTAPRAQLCALARAAGITQTHDIHDARQWQACLEEILPVAAQTAQSARGPIFVEVHVLPGYDRQTIPARTHTPQALQTQGGPGFHALRALLARD